MARGLIPSNGTYPSANGIHTGAIQMLAGFQETRKLASLTIGGTVGTSPTYKLQSYMQDSSGVSQWVDIANSTLTAAGTLVVPFVGQAIALNATNGSGASGVYYELEVFEDANNDIPLQKGY